MRRSAFGLTLTADNAIDDASTARTLLLHNPYSLARCVHLALSTTTAVARNIDEL